MVITKSTLKILKYVYLKKTVSYKSLCKHFRKNDDLLETLEHLVYQHYLEQVGGHQTNLGNSVPIINETLFKMDELGTLEVEHNQWFNLPFVLTSLVLPIIVGVASSAITALILALFA